MIALAKEYGRYGYRTVTGLLRQEGWNVGKDRVYTIWRQEGLQVSRTRSGSVVVDLLLHGSMAAESDDLLKRDWR